VEVGGRGGDGGHEEEEAAGVRREERRSASESAIASRTRYLAKEKPRLLATLRVGRIRAVRRGLGGLTSPIS